MILSVAKLEVGLGENWGDPLPGPSLEPPLFARSFESSSPVGILATEG